MSTIDNIESTRDWLKKQYSKISISERTQGYLFIAPAIILFLAISIAPIIYGFWLSFQSGFGATNLQFIGVDNYKSIANDNLFWTSISNGIVYTVYSIVTQVVLGVAIALFINKSFKFGNVLRTIVLVPYLVPIVAVVMVFKWMLNNQYGIINYVAQTIGVINHPINFFSTKLAMHTLVWAGNWKLTIFVVIMVLARVQSIDGELYEVAKINGSNWYHQFIDVTYPHIRSVVFLVLLLRGIWQFSKFDFIWLLTKGGPFNETTTVVIYAYLQAFTQFQMGTGAAVTVIIFFILAITAIIYFTRFNPQEEVEV